mmetsp:Transcript_32428/g.73215  ORF Transcript_32428/g.73215 Transcript_32428/m.73215 type:complete len:214 (-) Transcript_32428:84-725(-)
MPPFTLAAAENLLLLLSLGRGRRRRGRLLLLGLWLGLRGRLVLALPGGSSDNLALAGSLVFVTPGLSLVSEGLLQKLLLLGLVDVLHQYALVLELVTLGLQVEGVVQVLVQLLLLAVLLEQAAQHTHSADPQDFHRHTRLLCAPALTVPRMPPLALGLSPRIRACPRVNLLGLFDHEAILDELADILARVGHRDLVDLIRVKPDLPLPALEHG